MDPARRLIISLTLKCAAIWFFRFLKPCSYMPLLLLRFVETPYDRPCTPRQSIANMLLDNPTCCLRVKTSDIATKLKALFLLELREAAASGLCNRMLWVFILLIRSQLPLGTPQIEGMNSIIQRMATGAPHIGLALAATQEGKRHHSGRVRLRACGRLAEDDNKGTHEQVLPAYT